MVRRTTLLNLSLLLILSLAAVFSAGTPLVAGQAESPLFLPFLAQQPTAPAAVTLPTATATVQASCPCACSGNLYNCGDFDTRSEAQACYDWCIQFSFSLQPY